MLAEVYRFLEEWHARDGDLLRIVEAIEATITYLPLPPGLLGLAMGGPNGERYIVGSDALPGTLLQRPAVLHEAVHHLSGRLGQCRAPMKHSIGFEHLIELSGAMLAVSNREAEEVARGALTVEEIAHDKGLPREYAQLGCAAYLHREPRDDRPRLGQALTDWQYRLAHLSREIHLPRTVVPLRFG